ncbi:MAG: Cytidylate kinase [candidate division WS6 bacterium 34_10]|jgi:cytidylate kinase|uniref:Cytidylate kinase n=1 Tax=candidate division WS6 bacterium 34_10 TaxID=1641389 RepID=A0A117M090_9BACT|nr:MAG: Cytidylate kinase [candidate division WS6 bacterium 34_10]
MNKQFVLVIGGPGKSGSSTIGKMLAEHFNVDRIYGGKFFREEAKKDGFSSVKDFLEEMPQDEIERLDIEVDNKLREYAKRGSVLIESKTFAAIATIENIPCSSKIWLDADLNVRVERAVKKEQIENPIYRSIRRFQIRRELVNRYKIDKQRYKKLYGIDYENPKKYNDLVIDNSKQSPEETFNLIVNFLKDAGIKKE